MCSAMSLCPAPGSLLLRDWHQSAEAKEYVGSLLRKNARKVFGLIERPVLPPQVAADTVSYKIFVSGKSGVGKTAMVAKLVGQEVPSVHHETTGIQTATVYWPVKLKSNSQVLLFKFQFWDCGEATLKKFDHILPACKEKADAVLLLFSFTDRLSFDDLPNQIARVLDGSEKLARIVVGSKFDQYMHTDVTEQDVTEFQHTWQLPVLRMKSVNGPRLADGWTLDGRAGLTDVAHILNRLAENLWHYDQVAAGLVPAD
nr:ciliogenesis and planar polarity effector 2 isoform X2 [Geotrypetes seraphini]XP_033778514.1 ciliogenesis and planar polarity effector 2 isoform X2 [Geotrypetes seraphini]